MIPQQPMQRCLAIGRAADIVFAALGFQLTNKLENLASTRVFAARSSQDKESSKKASNLPMGELGEWTKDISAKSDDTANDGENTPSYWLESKVPSDM
jgi:hypothetical protein